MKRAWSAIKFLTAAGRFDTARATSEQIGAAAAFFPVVGALVGLVLVFLNRMLEPFVESEIEAALVVLALVVMTAATHLEGIQKTVDRLMAAEPGAGVTVHGIVAVILLVTLKIRSIEVMGETRAVSLFLAPVLARWAPLIFLYGNEWASGEPSRRTAKPVSAWQLFFASAATLAIAVYLTGRVGLWIGLWVSLCALFSRTYFHQHERGFTRENLGAVIEISETLSLVLLATL